MDTPNKYPSTYHWPWSKTVHRDDSYHKNHENFLGRPVIITEKIDGGNTGLFNGEVYARSVTQPSHDGWMAMVRKNHAWKTNAPEFKDMEIYGEDIYGIHSIEYAPVNELDTYMIFAVRFQDEFLSWDDVCSIATAMDIKTVPVLAETTYESASELTAVLEAFTDQPSRIGTDREGCVVRSPEAFLASEFGDNVCKYVRANHVQTDQHWRVNWQPCKVIY
jgi:ATP-dependent RNA circularization protein (DNA/RNA ligase family)